jgi:hypothetical protein
MKAFINIKYLVHIGFLNIINVLNAKNSLWDVGKSLFVLLYRQRDLYFYKKLLIQIYSITEIYGRISFNEIGL